MIRETPTTPAHDPLATRPMPGKTLALKPIAPVAVRHADVGATGQLDPDVETVLRLVAKAKRPHYWQMTPAQARETYERAAPILEIDPLRVHHVEELAVARADGGSVPVRLYLPREASWAHPLPVLVYLHGGGFTVGSIDTVDAVVRMFCARAECAVVSVDYRLAPEHRFPAAFDDAFSVVRWAATRAHEFGLDTKRVAVGGDSAGGTLAAACAHAARDAGIALALQLLIYPGTCAHQDTGSHFAYADGYLLTRQTILWFFDQYMDVAADRDDWRFAPLAAPSFDRLAPSWIAVAEFDPLVDEGVAYARALAAAGNVVELKFYAGMIHSFFNMGGFIAAARGAHADAVAALQDALHGEPTRHNRA